VSVSVSCDQQEITVSDQSKRTTQYEWAKAMKADLLIIVRQVAWKLSEPELTELYRLWRHWGAEVERLAPGSSGSSEQLTA
jgi:predicted DNA-binding transcriptional regulator YafY